ncbi:hypothetical protein [Streptomyces sp. CRPSP2-6A1]|nr:hypothetical protein [Streptomyces sp. CRPSP2-6A1]
MPITAPDEDLFVSPLYLASCTITGDPAFAPPARWRRADGQTV